MPQCKKCKALLAPNFVDDGICLFCKDNLITISYGEHGEKRATKSELVKEYVKFLAMIKERVEVRNKVIKGDTSVVPEKLIG
jgi:RNase P subunit RPR2